MEELLRNIDWKFVIGDIIVPIGLFVAGIFVGGAIERRKYKAKAEVQGNGNIVMQNNDIRK